MAYRLDLYTIIVLTAISAFLMGAGMIAASAAQSSLGRPLQQWGLSCLLQGTGWILVGLRDQVPDWLSIAIGNSAILLSSLCYWRSIDLFMRAQRTWLPTGQSRWIRRALWVISLLFAPLLLLFTNSFPSLQVRIIIISSALAYITLLCAYRLLSHPPIPLSRRLLGYGFGVVALSQMLRIVVTIAIPPHKPELFSARFPDVITFLVGFIAVVMLTFLFALMVNDHSSQELRRLATHDSLTKLFNRSAFEGYARQAIEQTLRKDDTLSLLLFDIDHFKSINDTHGHHAGDVALRQMAKVAGQGLRSQDVFGRYGGEEFAALLPGTDAAGAFLVAERIRHNVENAIFHDNGKDFQLTISIGVAQFESSGEVPTEMRLTALSRAADEALYDAKNRGRNRTVIASSMS